MSYMNKRKLISDKGLKYNFFIKEYLGLFIWNYLRYYNDEVLNC